MIRRLTCSRASMWFPHGVSYNSYLIFDEKVALMDTVDARGMEQWEKNLLAALDGRKVDYLIVSQLEPDHAGSIGRLVELFPGSDPGGKCQDISDASTVF